MNLANIFFVVLLVLSVIILVFFRKHNKGVIAAIIIIMSLIFLFSGVYLCFACSWRNIAIAFLFIAAFLVFCSVLLIRAK